MNKFLFGPLFAPAGVAGGGNGGSGDPPPPLTMEAVLTEVGKKVDTQIATHFEKFRKEGLGTAIDEKLAPINTSLTGIQEAIGKLASGNQGGGQGGGDKGNQIPPEINVKLQQLTETTRTQGTEIATLRKQKEDADKRSEVLERHGTIREALTSLNFINEAAAKTAFTIVEPFVKKMDNGEFVGGINDDNFPINDFARDYLTKEHSYLLRPSGLTGSGAPANGGVRMGVRADLNDIKPGMKPETRDAVVASISAAYQQANGS